MANLHEHVCRDGMRLMCGFAPQRRRQPGPHRPRRPPPAPDPPTPLSPSSRPRPPRQRRTTRSVDQTEHPLSLRPHPKRPVSTGRQELGLGASTRRSSAETERWSAPSAPPPPRPPPAPPPTSPGAPPALPPGYHHRPSRRQARPHRCRRRRRVVSLARWWRRPSTAQSHGITRSAILV